MPATIDAGEAAGDLVLRVLMADPTWAAYALADLQPAFAPYCRWLTAQAGEGEGVALHFTLLEPPVLLTAGAPDAVAAALADAELPPEVYVSLREEHVPAVAAHYADSAERRPMLRMRLAAPDLALGDCIGAVQLRREDAGRVLQLYAHGGPFCPDAFTPGQMEDGIFFGVEDEHGLLAAAGGTHIVDWTQGIVAIGNMYTRPDARRRGYARTVLAAIVRQALAQGAHNVVLNVDRRNAGAQAMYLALGFTVHTPYVEGIWRKSLETP